MYKKFLPLTLLFSLLLALLGILAFHEHDVAVFSFADEKRVYLTFDDGPSTVVTNRILNTLKKEDVKATFFIVSDRAKTRSDTLKRIAREGHSLGVHSCTHDYATIYASDDAFLKDVTDCADYIFKTTGIVPKLYRFPGGGSSRKQERAVLLKERGYRIIGWNAVCGDEEIYGASASTLIEETIRSSKGKSTVVLLMHDSAPHKETAEALPAIISYYRMQGYVFCAF